MQQSAAIILYGMIKVQPSITDSWIHICEVYGAE